MSSTPVPGSARRAGYVVAAVLNGILLWISHQLLDWEWPSFLTPEFDDVLPWVTVSFVVGIVTNVGYAIDDRGWRKPLGELVNAVVGLVVAIRMWQVFPFDFSGWDTDWSWAVRTAIVVGIVGTSIGILAYAIQLVRCATGPGADGGSG